jgi:hypothetical protein
MSHGRKSPFLPGGMRPQGDAVDGSGASDAGWAAQPEWRHGFGFGAPRRDDPVRHVPLDSLAAEPGSGRPGETDGTDVSDDTEFDAGAVKAGPSAGATDALTEADIDPGSGADAADEAPSEHRPIISPDFARRTWQTPPPDVTEPPSTGPREAVTEPEDVPSEPELAVSAPRADDMEQGVSSGAEASLEGEDAPGPDQPETAGEEEHTRGRAGGFDTGRPPSDPVGAAGAEADTSGEAALTSPPSPVAARPSDQAEAQPERTPERTTASATPFNLFGDTETSIDEEALRVLISEVVQRELQGVLGERVSRNIRALVRREIARALAARELD